MKLPCKVIEDLLPLYQDGVCSGESRKLVEEHLSECADCRAVLDEIRGTLSVPAVPLNDAEPLKKIRSEWIKIRKRSLLKGMAAAFMAVLIVFGCWSGVTQLRIFPVPLEKIEVSNVAVMSDGVIGFTLFINDGKPLNVLESHPDYENGVAYITPKRALLERSNSNPVSLTVRNGMDYYVEMEPYTREQFQDIDYYEKEITDWILNDSSGGKADYYYTAEIKKVCIGTEKNHIVLWEEGMELPAAGTEREMLYQSGIR